MLDQCGRPDPTGTGYSFDRHDDFHAGMTRRGGGFEVDLTKTKGRLFLALLLTPWILILSLVLSVPFWR